MCVFQARKIPGCRVHLGDRPIGITLRRALGALTWYQKLRLAWYLITSKEPIRSVFAFCVLFFCKYLFSQFAISFI